MADTIKRYDYTGPSGTHGANSDQENLPDELVTVVADICRKTDSLELQPRIKLVRHVQKTRFFRRGVQYLNLDAGAGGGYSAKFADPSTPSKDDDRDPMYTFNIYWASGRSFVATFAQAAVGVAFEPNDPREEADTTASTEADNAKKIVCKVNNQRDLQKEIANILWTDPYVVFKTEDSTNGSRFGYDKDGKPRHFPEITVEGALEWKVPIACGDFADWTYMRRQQEFDLNKLKEDYPDKKEKLSATGTAKDVDYSRTARLSTQEGLESAQSSGDSMAYMGTKSEYWLRPAQFNEVEEKKQATLREWFPNGAYVAFVGDEYCRSRNEDMADHLEVFKGDPGKGYATPGLGDIAMGPQECYNDLANLTRITFVRGVPHRYVDQDLIPSDAIKHQKNNPGTIHPVQNPNQGTALQNYFFEETPGTTPGALTQTMENLQGPLTQFLTGQQPALFGGEMGQAGKTATGYGQALAQAMGQMTIVWVPYKKAWASVIAQAVGILAKTYADQDEISTTLNAGTPQASTVTLNLNNLKGKFLTSPDTDENFPESWSMKRANYQGCLAIADKSPEMGKMLMHPDNIRQGKDLMGLKDFVDPEEDSRDKQSAEIELMLEQPAVPTPEAAQMLQQAQASGQEVPPEMLAQAPMKSSVDVDEECDDHAVEWETVRTWINSPQGRKIRLSNAEGFKNVRLHGLEHKKLVDQAQAGPQNKPPSTSINFKDLPMDGQQQLAAEAGLNLAPPPPPVPVPNAPQPMA